jgi:hypothetical protein
MVIVVVIGGNEGHVLELDDEDEDEDDVAVEE